MPTKYLRNAVSRRVTPQSQPIPNSGQVANSAGGYSYQLDKWKMLDRFLILGSEGGSYYASEKELTFKNVQCVEACLKEDGIRAIKRAVEISEAGRAPKNTPAIFLLAVACAKEQSLETRQYAFAMLPKVCRIATHLYQFIGFVQEFRGWGRGLRKAVRNWYAQQSPEQLAYSAIKYKAREGWSHADVMRKSHGKFAPEHNAVVSYMVDGKEGKNVNFDVTPQIRAHESLFNLTEPKLMVQLIRDHRLPFEAVPTEYRDKPEVQEALFDHMPMTAMIRNLANYTRSGLIAPNSTTSREVVARLGDRERLRKARIHPIAVLMAQMAYGSGDTGRGGRSWTPVKPILSALEEAFYASFDFVEPTNKRWLLGLDVSGSMSGGAVGGINGFTPAMATAALSLVTTRVEKCHEIYGFADTFKDLGVTSKDSLAEAMRKVRRNNFGGTDCALPMTYALSKKIPVDVFLVMTDSETWAGRSHPSQALAEYRQKMGIDAKLAVMGLVSNPFTIADPNDVGMLDIVGFDTAVPTILRGFALGE